LSNNVSLIYNLLKRKKKEKKEKNDVNLQTQCVKLSMMTFQPSKFLPSIPPPLAVKMPLLFYLPT
jgi:hypothetical protein